MALALVLGAAGTASQAVAATKHHHRNGLGAYARAVDDGSQGESEGVMSAARAKALRDCSAEMNKLVQKDWGVMQNTDFAACMTQHGEMP
jgi:hypothetical protein